MQIKNQNPLNDPPAQIEKGNFDHVTNGNRRFQIYKCHFSSGQIRFIKRIKYKSELVLGNDSKIAILLWLIDVTVTINLRHIVCQKINQSRRQKKSYCVCLVIEEFHHFRFSSWETKLQFIMPWTCSEQWAHNRKNFS